MAIRLGICTALILAYVVVAALDISRGILAPVIVVSVAAALFFPTGKIKHAEDHTGADHDEAPSSP